MDLNIIKFNKTVSNKKFDIYALNRLVYKIESYEPGILNIIKFFLYPGENEYKFYVGEIVKQIYYEMSYHSHFRNDLNGDMNTNMYCECYFNRKHQNPSDLKKHKCVKLLRIEKLDYDEDTFEKQYLCAYGFAFNYLTTLNENDINKLNEL
jgi:hypothetical protein